MQLVSITMLRSGLPRTLLVNAPGASGPETEGRQDVLLLNEDQKLLWM